jgi:hypothetical protein
MSRSRMLVVAVLLSAGLWATGRLSAQEPSAQAKSLALVPADAASYTVLLRNGEQLAAIANSKAWAKLNALPFVKMVKEKFDEEWNKQGGFLGGVKQWYEQPDNAALLRLGLDLISDEVFVYSARNSADFANFLGMIVAANQNATLLAALRGDPGAANDPMHRFKLILKVLSDNADDIKLPDVVIGFRVKDKAPVEKQLKRLDDLVKALDIPAQIVQTKQIGGKTFRVLQVSGAMLPWDRIPIGAFEEQAGDLDKLVKRVKELKLTVALGLRDDFLLLSIGEGTAGIEALGKGAALAGVKELKPLAKFADKKLTSISYISKEFQKAVSPGKDDIAGMSSWILDVVKNAGLPEELQQKMKRDLKEFTKDMQRFVSEPGAHMSFNFMTERGSEGYAYDWTTNHGLDASKTLTLLDHLGGDPLFFTLSRAKYDPKSYEVLSKWAKIGYGYVEEHLLPNIPGEIREPFDRFMRAAKPHMARMDTATAKMLLPALADGQTAFVLDGKLKNKQWHAFMPPADKDLPFPEFAIVCGVSDAELLKKAFKEYRTGINGILDAVSQIVPIGQLELPEPEHKMVMGGELYYYTLPALLGLDARLMPAAGLANHMVAFTFSKEHATRLLTNTPMRLEGVLKANSKRPLASATHVNVAGVLDMVALWAEYGLSQAGVGNDAIEQVQAVAEILKVFRTYASVTYLQDGAMVTHNETIIRDLGK